MITVGKEIIVVCKNIFHARFQIIKITSPIETSVSGIATQNSPFHFYPWLQKHDWFCAMNGLFYAGVHLVEGKATPCHSCCAF